MSVLSILIGLLAVPLPPLPASFAAGQLPVSVVTSVEIDYTDGATGQAVTLLSPPVVVTRTPGTALRARQVPAATP